LLANPASIIGAHAHAGRLGFELWYKGSPVIIDSGCCNYDDPALISWFRTTKAHNTVLIDNKSDICTSSPETWAPKRETGNKIKNWHETNEICSLTMISPADELSNSGVMWTRIITMIRNSFFIISDFFYTDCEHNYKLLFHFPVSEIHKNTENKSLIISTINDIALIPADASLIQEVNIIDGMISKSGVVEKAPVAAFSFNGKRNIESHIIIASCEKDCEVKKVSIKHFSKSSLITILSGNGIKDKVSVSRKGINLM
jgi:hypothetical protein